MACNCLPALLFPADVPTGVRMQDLANGNVVDCPICADPLTADSTAHPWTGPAPFLVEGCANGHVYHKGCLLTWMARTGGSLAVCPDCRAPLLPAVVQSLQSQGTPTPAPEPSEAERQETEGPTEQWMRTLPDRIRAITRNYRLTPYQRNQALLELRRQVMGGGPPRRPAITPSAVAARRQLQRQQAQLDQRRRQREAYRARASLPVGDAARRFAEQLARQREPPQ